MIRACFYIDGFNVYHAIHDLGDPSLKWLNMRALAETLIKPRTEAIAEIYYFSAFADFRPDAKKRHEQYVAALESTGIQIVMGNFKKKQVHAWCDGPGHAPKKVTRNSHEEKESDVNLALYLVRDAYEDVYDIAYVISSDSDLVPAMRMVRAKRPEKNMVTVAAPLRGHAQSALTLGLEKKKINLDQLKRCLFPMEVRDGLAVVARCPNQYRRATETTTAGPAV
jgi:uncharacterized LabA/DUF88 family protein